MVATSHFKDGGTKLVLQMSTQQQRYYVCWSSLPMVIFSLIGQVYWTVFQGTLSGVTKVNIQHRRRCHVWTSVKLNNNNGILFDVGSLYD